MENASVLAVPTHAYQLGLFENNGVCEASALHVSKTGFFSICYKNPETIKEAETQKHLLFDLKDYEERSHSWGELRANNSGYSSRSERMKQIETQIDKRARFPLRQRSYHVSAMPLVVANLFNGGDFAKTDFYYSQNSFSQFNRRATNLLHLNGLYVDIDIDKSDHWSKKLTPTQQGEAFADWCHDNNIPLSLILHSGGGLHCKIWFETSVSYSAKPIWDAMEKSLINKIREGGWPVDESVCDVSRILRINGTVNQKNGKRVHDVWVNGSRIEDALRYDFNWLADSKKILQFTRAEVSEFRKVQNFYKENELKAIAAGMRNGLKEAHLLDLSYKQLWHFRLDVIRKYVAGHFSHGVPEGMRNNFAYFSALCLAWSCGDCDDYFEDLIPVVKEICPTLSNSEISSSASSVTKRVLEQNQKQYKYRNSTFYEKLKIPESFVSKVRSAHGFGRDRSNWNEGVMGNETIRDLPFDEYVLEVRKRQSDSADRTNKIQQEKYRKEREQALIFIGQGLSIREVAKVLNVSKSSVQKWAHGK